MKNIYLLLLPAIMLASGCASLQSILSDADAQALFDKAIVKLEQRLDKPTTPTPTDPTTPTPTPPNTAVDEVDYASLVWSNGGFSGKGARLDPVARITNLTFSKAALAYRWAGGGCEALGAKSAGDSDATICAVFFRHADGTWRGGKFDWISTSRTSREMKHINGSTPYHNWDASVIPNPADSCFVIVSVRTGTRTNVIKSIWRR